MATKPTCVCVCVCDTCSRCGPKVPKARNAGSGVEGTKKGNRLQLTGETEMVMVHRNIMIKPAGHQLSSHVLPIAKADRNSEMHSNNLHETVGHTGPLSSSFRGRSVLSSASAPTSGNCRCQNMASLCAASSHLQHVFGLRSGYTPAQNCKRSNEATMKPNCSCLSAHVFLGQSGFGETGQAELQLPLRPTSWVQVCGGFRAKEKLKTTFAEILNQTLPLEKVQLFRCRYGKAKS